MSEQIESEKLPKKKEEYQKYYKYYIENFLPALKDKVIGSEKLAKLPVFNKEKEQSQGPETRKGEIVGIILEITNKENDKNHPNNTIRNQGHENLEIDDEEELGKSTKTCKLNGGPNSPVPSEKNPPQSPVSSRRGSISTTLSSSEEDGHPQKEEFEQQKQNPEEKPKKQKIKTQMVKQIQSIMITHKKEMGSNVTTKAESRRKAKEARK